MDDLRGPFDIVTLKVKRSRVDGRMEYLVYSGKKAKGKSQSKQTDKGVAEDYAALEQVLKRAVKRGS